MLVFQLSGQKRSALLTASTKQLYVYRLSWLPKETQQEPQAHTGMWKKMVTDICVANFLLLPAEHPVTKQHLTCEAAVFNCCTVPFTLGPDLGCSYQSG